MQWLFRFSLFLFHCVRAQTAALAIVPSFGKVGTYVFLSLVVISSKIVVSD